MKLGDYLNRVAYSGSTSPSLDSLIALLRSHVLNVPFENLDVQLGIPLTTDPEAAFDKIVTRKRGGWCYEQNGLFGWALSEIGFKVTRVAAAVSRNERGADALANHLCLLVSLPDDPDAAFLADVGFGGSMVTPIPLAVAQHEQSPFRIGLTQVEDDYWRFSESAGADSESFDFTAEAGDESALSKKCGQLQTSPDSSFVLNSVVQKRTFNSHVSLRGRVLVTTKATGKESRTLESADEFVVVLKRIFRISSPEAAALWPGIVARHEALFG